MKEFHNSIEVSSVAQFNACFDLVNDLVFLFSPASHTFLAANKAFYQLLHITADEGEKKMSELFTSEVDLQKCTIGNAIDTVLTTKTGHKISVQMKIHSARLNNSNVLLGVAKDLTPQERMQDQLDLAKNEKDTLLNEVYHRVKNNLNIIVSLLSLQINRVEEASVRHLLLESKSRILTLAVLQQKLYESPRISEVMVNDYLAYLGARIVSSFKPSHKNIRVISSIGNCWFDVDTLVPLGLITNELVTNSVIHAFPVENSGEISMIMEKVVPGQFIYRIKDNGIGLSQGNDLNKYTRTLGYQLVLSLAKQLNAQVEVESSENAGLDISFLFNLTNYECT